MFYVNEISEDNVPLIAEDIKSQLDGDGESLNQVDSVEDTEGLDVGYYWYSKYCKIIIAMCFFGGLSAFIGYVLAPECSDADTAFEEMGIFAFQMSWLCFAICPIIWIISIFNPEVNSYGIFFWTLGTGIAMVISSAIFMDYILQDMFCGCWGICGIGTGWGG
tara:strand:+ start:110 stop:598 length:489 start_codon:yes stop_codon:yes gene_type:complete